MKKNPKNVYKGTVKISSISAFLDDVNTALQKIPEIALTCHQLDSARKLFQGTTQSTSTDSVDMVRKLFQGTTQSTSTDSVDMVRQYNDLAENHQALQKRYEELQQKFSNLQADFDAFRNEVIVGAPPEADVEDEDNVDSEEQADDELADYDASNKAVDSYEKSQLKGWDKL